MPLNKLLDKQIKKYLPDDYLKDERIVRFLKAVGDSYIEYEKDLALSAHAFRISEQEYADINEKLKQEIWIKKLGIENLKDAIKSIEEDGGDPEAIDNEEDNLIDTLAYLKAQILKMKKMETELRATKVELEQRVKQFQSLSENIPGVIFEYEFRKDDTEGYRYLSPAMEKVFGIKAEDFYDFSRYIHPDDIAGIESRNRYSKRTLSPFNHESRLVIPGKAAIWRSVNSSFSYQTEDGAVVFTGLMLDINEKKTTEELLRRNEEKYRGIITNMNLGILELDMNGKIHFVNQRFCEMSGYKNGELLGKNASRIFGNEDNNELLRSRNISWKTRMAELFELPVRDKENRQKWWLISGSPQLNEQGELIGSIAIHLDITGQKLLEKELTEAKQQAEESSRSKELFLANMSHEIRTPMNGILGMSRQLQKTELNIKQRIYLDTINSAAEILLVVINDILDISKIEAGKLILEKIGFRMQDVLDRVIRVMQYKTEEKGLRLILLLDEAIHPVLQGDPYRLSQVLLNLLSNAVKFTEKGTVTIECLVTGQFSHLQTVCIKVTDTGIGMEAEFLDQLFLKFSQEDESVARKYGGTGLGMSISKQLVELMGGHISVSSQKGKGTEIILDIPFDLGDERDLPRHDDATIDASILMGKRILLVEDNEINRFVAISILSGYGAVVHEALNGVEAIEMLEADKGYDLILMDVQMPVMDGLEATRIIRRDIDVKIPVIALTASAIKGESDQCTDAGMDGYVSKPFAEEELIKMIAHFLGPELEAGAVEIPVVTARSADPEVIAPVQGPGDMEQTSGLETPLYNLDKLWSVGRGDKHFIQKVVKLFMESVPPAVGEMKGALAGRDLATIYSLAHRIKPILDDMQIKGGAAGIREIERLASENDSSIVLEELIAGLETTIDKVVAKFESDREWRE